MVFTVRVQEPSSRMVAVSFSVRYCCAFIIALNRGILHFGYEKTGKVGSTIPVL
ncbi:MAG: hypothetical protein H0S77_06940 [Spirochaetaceae bacterium]|jgi:hypothetical protein|nr:hypothetical protein [Spirochaetaceae bacterium]MDN5334649.1 hypothetical protein [Sphaerochaeta sp.]